MKRIKISLLALATIAGMSSAFINKKQKTTSYEYGVLGLTAGGHGYIIETFNVLSSCIMSDGTCSITSFTILASPVATNAVPANHKYPGTYIVD